MSYKPSSEIALRPGYGGLGKQITLKANFFQIISLPNETINQYHVIVGDGSRVPRKQSQLIWNSKEVKQYFGSSWMNSVYDGRSMCWSKGDIADGTIKVNIGSESHPREIEFSIQKSSKINLHTLSQFVNSKYSSDPQVLSSIMFLDLLLKKKPSETLFGFMHSFFTGENGVSLGGGVEAWKGFYQSIRPNQGFMSVNVDISSSAFWRNDSLLQILMEYTDCSNVRDLTRFDLKRLSRKFRFLKVTCQHRNNVGTDLANRVYSIEGFSSKSASDSFFVRRLNGEEQKISVAEYFLENHNVRLQYPNLPCILVKNGAMLPIEFCFVVKGQRYTAKLNSDQTANMIRFAVQRPFERVQQIDDFVHQMDWDTDPYLTQYGMKIQKKMLEVPARVLETPSIRYGGDCIERPVSGRWNLRGKRFLDPPRAPIRSWAVMCFTSTRRLPMRGIENFLQTYVQTLTSLGINFVMKKPPVLYADIRGSVEELCITLYKKAEQVGNAPPDYLFFILDKNSPEPYGSIKRVCNTMLGVPSQCAISKHILQSKPQYCANLGMKINVKVGGINCSLIPKSNPLGNVPTLILGGDVYHPGVGATGVSIASIVASVDLNGCKYTAVSRSQPRHQEVIEGMKDIVVYLLQGFRAMTKQQPQRIIYFRDGTSEGQFLSVINDELSQIKEACHSLSPKYNPKILVCTTQKRHHARFFIKNKSDGDRNGNPLPGTIIEKHVTHPYQYDFYLISHPSLQGVSVPVHYTVLHDEIQMPPDQFQTLCYNLCYVYARATSAVSLVPPVYYAHLVSNLARYQDVTADDTFVETSEASMDQEVKPLLALSSKLKTKMWYM
ncbi:argonaute [Schizosaccharomyces pombe]|uniref:Protein argonaute n=1 Tax=Schizosaccharomyces pombe (strain 972 / ATCC 24843) TaxID=284812 RepID=AGO1_SCHPO|nr:argonaute [Schizosaccharomyces pombe]O74957.1 RecName: Full=Protein argonaute; AltName: Full=Cell cycle control protein ago1; AltName: Full=Eukaryotic translation initiation factor 2C 2-like protein ago1; AltName: Full=PAZ Piwi domain protein ago1; AltName: Full=Protein slicer; AltName: Full=RNA interference pathway protein ago1 [Schizosaccharomyces pombe 972h-]CAA19275.1 argonaute [Schizosaccharomyces pombe]|eukprot:NP_587782.1 argonaute [Schizosaccharomyces pombe]